MSSRAKAEIACLLVTNPWWRQGFIYELAGAEVGFNTFTLAIFIKQGVLDGVVLFCLFGLLGMEYAWCLRFASLLILVGGERHEIDDTRLSLSNVLLLHSKYIIRSILFND